MLSWQYWKDKDKTVWSRISAEDVSYCHHLPAFAPYASLNEYTNGITVINGNNKLRTEYLKQWLLSEMEYWGSSTDVLFPEGIVCSFCWLKHQWTTHDGMKLPRRLLTMKPSYCEIASNARFKNANWETMEVSLLENLYRPGYHCHWQYCLLEIRASLVDGFTRFQRNCSS